MANATSYDAIAGIISNLAKSHDPSADSSFSGKAVSNGSAAHKILLPGPDDEGKRHLERELAALAGRIQFLEAKANSPAGRAFPLTPSEPTSIMPFPSDGSNRAAAPLVGRTAPGLTRDQKAVWVSNWLASRGDTAAAAAQNGSAQLAPLTEEQLSYLREHVNKQADEIRSQREHIDSLGQEVSSKLRDQDIAVAHGIEDIAALKRELAKHQQANLAFQKALREIGNIVTAVANGDLSKKVLIHTRENDPEIATFKRTINKMVDQLQDFASQVTFLAKEVGTEGRLGGQANLPGVAGIWAELTDSGMFFTLFFMTLLLRFATFERRN